MKGIDARLRALERKAEGEAPAAVILFGDDPVPGGITEHTTVLRFEEEDRGL